MQLPHLQIPMQYSVAMYIRQSLQQLLHDALYLQHTGCTGAVLTQVRAR